MLKRSVNSEEAEKISEDVDNDAEIFDTAADKAAEEHAVILTGEAFKPDVQQNRFLRRVMITRGWPV